MKQKWREGTVRAGTLRSRRHEEKTKKSGIEERNASKDDGWAEEDDV